MKKDGLTFSLAAELPVASEIGVSKISIFAGVVVANPGLVAFSGGPHPNAAKVYINWLLSKEEQNVYGRVASVVGIRTDITDYRPEAACVMAKRPIVVTDEDKQEAARLFEVAR